MGIRKLKGNSATQIKIPERENFLNLQKWKFSKNPRELESILKSDVFCPEIHDILIFLVLTGDCIPPPAGAHKDPCWVYPPPAPSWISNINIYVFQPRWLVTLDLIISEYNFSIGVEFYSKLILGEMTRTSRVNHLFCIFEMDNASRFVW